MGFSIGEAIFGQSPSTDVSSKPITSGAQQQVGLDLGRFLFGGRSDLPSAGASSAKGKFVPFEDPIVGDLSSLEQLSLAGLEQMVANLTAPQTGAPPGDATTATTRQSQQSFMDMLTRGPEDFEQFFRTNVFEPGLEEFTEEILPEVSARNAADFFSSERLKQDERVTEDFVEAMVGGRERFAFESQENQLGRVLEALGMAPSISGLETGLLERGLAAGAVPRDVETSQRLARYEEFLRGQDRDMDIMRLMAGFSTSPTVETVAATKGGSSGLLGPFLQGLGSRGFGGGGSSGAAVLR